MHQKNSFLIKIAILFSDLLALATCFATIYTLRLTPPTHDFFFMPRLWFSIFVTILSLYVFGCYDFNKTHGRYYYAVRTSASVIFAAILTLAVHYLFAKDRSGFFGRGIFLGGSLLYLFVAIAARAILAKILLDANQSTSWIFIISEESLPMLQKDLISQKFLGNFSFYTPENFVKLPEQERTSQSIVVGVKNTKAYKDLPQFLVKVKFNGRLVMDLVSFYELYWKKVPYYYIDEEWIFAADGFTITRSRFNLRLKRLADLFFSGIIFGLTWPIMIITAGLIKIESSGNAIFTQVRTGKDDHEFKIYKFRSMREDAESNGAQWATTNDIRATLIGKFIRKSRIDELPQLANVLRGEMSFVGPRPERPVFNEILDKEIPFYGIRHSVLPGLTGWAQINYPYGASIEDAKEKLSYELYYIKNHSFLLDLKIILKTVQIVLFGRGR